MIDYRVTFTGDTFPFSVQADRITYEQSYDTTWAVFYAGQRDVARVNTEYVTLILSTPMDR